MSGIHNEKPRSPESHAHPESRNSQPNPIVKNKLQDEDVGERIFYKTKNTQHQRSSQRSSQKISNRSRKNMSDSIQKTRHSQHSQSRKIKSLDSLRSQKSVKNDNPQFVAKGAFGCVYRPSLFCDNENKNFMDHITNGKPTQRMTAKELKIYYKNIDKYNTKYANKISKKMDGDYAIAELQTYVNLTNIFKDIPQEDKFFIDIPTMCENKKINTDCKVKTKTPDTILIMDDAGMDLMAFASKIEKNKFNNRQIVDFWNEAVKLFGALVYLNEKEYGHFDLKDMNITYNPQTNKAYLIDFGELKNREDISEDGNPMIQNYFPYDCIFLRLKHFTKPQISQIITIFTCVLENYITNKISSIQLEEYLKSNDLSSICHKAKIPKGHPLLPMINIFINQMSYKLLKLKSISTSIFTNSIIELNELKTELVKSAIKPKNYEEKQLYTIDSYCLGFALFVVLQKSREYLNTEFFKEAEKLFRSMFSENTFARKNPEEYLKNYKDILPFNTVII
jgi:hypothetical protein